MALSRRLIDPETFLRARTATWDMTPAAIGDEEAPPDISSSVQPSNALSFAGSAFQPPSRQPNVVNDIYAPQLRDVGEKLNAAFQPPKLGFGGNLRALAGAFVSQRNPQLGSIISGDYGRMRNIGALQNQYKLIEDAINQNRAMNVADLNARNVESEIQGRADLAKYHQDTLNQPKPKEESWSVLEGATGPNGELVQQEKNSGQIRLVNAGSITQKSKTENDFEQFYSQWRKDKKQQDTAANRLKAKAQWSAAGKTPQDVEMQEINKNLKKAQLEKAQEPTPDEQRRDDLARNLEENLTTLEGIAKRRPELFGPLAGRVTTARQFIGTSDPDVAALKNIEEQMGLAMVGAHAMRNAQHAEKAAQSITGAQKTTADALLAPNGPIATARKSVQTFREDAQRRRKALQGGGSSAPVNSKDPAGLFE